MNSFEFYRYEKDKVSNQTDQDVRNCKKKGKRIGRRCTKSTHAFTVRDGQLDFKSQKQAGMFQPFRK